MSAVPAVVRLPAATLLALVLGALGLLHPATSPYVDLFWHIALYGFGIPVLWDTVRGILHGRWATDLVAALAILTAMFLDQPFAGLIIVLMQSGGAALEAHAVSRATAAVRLLEAEAPQIAHRIAAPGVVDDVSVDRVVVGDRLLVRPGEMVPCDGTVVAGHSSVDTARVTGEPLPLTATLGTSLQSGMVNLSGPLTLSVTAPARESLYARVVELVRHAQASKAPVQRVADRFAIWFTPLTLGVCVLAWFASGEALRVLAVLVVATPCPMLLATPVAILGGVNRAARDQIIIRHGGALESLARVNTVVFDKTGTLTVGRPEVVMVESAGAVNENQILSWASAVEHGASHPLARSIERAASERQIPLLPTTATEEFPGRGVRGTVEGRRVVVGSTSLVRELEPGIGHVSFSPVRHDLSALVAVDGRLVGRISFSDRIRPDAAAALQSLRSLGIDRTVLLSGDDPDNVSALAAELHFGEAHGGLLPDEKLAAVAALEQDKAVVLMVGDGTNDAPALSFATVGMALASHGGGISAESADVVLLGDQLNRVPQAVAIGRRTLRIAHQSLWWGLGLSGVAMIFAAAGGITPAVGAVLQEGIDVAVIANALRTAWPGSRVSS